MADHEVIAEMELEAAAAVSVSQYPPSFWLKQFTKAWARAILNSASAFRKRRIYRFTGMTSTSSHGEQESNSLA
jgi:hypothetical protein